LKLVDQFKQVAEKIAKDIIDDFALDPAKRRIKPIEGDEAGIAGGE
jgi:hypothetical protein